MFFSAKYVVSFLFSSLIAGNFSVNASQHTCSKEPSPSQTPSSAECPCPPSSPTSPGLKPLEPLYTDAHMGLHIGDLHLFMRTENTSELPSGYRSTQTEIAFSTNAVSQKGLRAIRMAGCAQFSQDQLQPLLTRLSDDFNGIKPHDVYVFDLREESHGFVQGHAIDWYLVDRNNINASAAYEAVVADEYGRLQSLGEKPCITVQDHPALKAKNHRFYILSTQDIKSEQSIVQAAGAHYLRIPVTDHLGPELRDIDLFVAYMHTLPPTAVSLFHCRGGRGRTTSFMAMMDMWHNAANISFQDIINRHACSSGATPLSDFSRPKPKWKTEEAKKRLKLLEIFHAYARDMTARRKLKFSEYYHRHVMLNA